MGVRVCWWQACCASACCGIVCEHPSALFPPVQVFGVTVLVCTYPQHLRISLLTASAIPPSVCVQVFGVTLDPFIVYSSNLFAILSLRGLYGFVSTFMKQMRFLDKAGAWSGVLSWKGGWWCPPGHFARAGADPM